jgi:hypothetical protein
LEILEGDKFGLAQSKRLIFKRTDLLKDVLKLLLANSVMFRWFHNNTWNKQVTAQCKNLDEDLKPFLDATVQEFLPENQTQIVKKFREAAQVKSKRKVQTKKHKTLPFNLQGVSNDEEYWKLIRAAHTSLNSPIAALAIDCREPGIRKTKLGNLPQQAWFINLFSAVRDVFSTDPGCDPHHNFIRPHHAEWKGNVFMDNGLKQWKFKMDTRIRMEGQNSG